MRIYLCGQKQFGNEVLAMIRRTGHELVGVSAPQTGKRGLPDPLYHSASVLGIPLLPAGELNAATMPQGVDLIVCAHSHDFIGRRTRGMTRYGAIGYHPSLLPLHRGRDAIRWAIAMGDKVTGGSVYWLDDNVDAGPIAAQDWRFIRKDDDARTLWKRDLLPLGVELLELVIRQINFGTAFKIPQDEALASFEPSFSPPPLKRPDLPQLGDGRDTGLRVITSREDLELADVAADVRLALSGVRG